MRFPTQGARIVMASAAVVGVALLGGCWGAADEVAKAGATAVDDLARGAGTTVDDLEPYLATEAQRLNKSQDDVAAGMVSRLRAKPLGRWQSVPNVDRDKACEVVTETLHAAFQSRTPNPADSLEANLGALEPEPTGSMWSEVGLAMQTYNSSGSVTQVLELMSELCPVLE